MAVFLMLALLASVYIWGALTSNRMLLSMHFCDSYEEIMGSQEETPDLDIRGTLLFNGFTVPYAAALNTFYISQNTSVDNWGGVFFSCPRLRGVFLCR